MGQSLWSRFAEEAVFLPVSQREAFAALVTQTDELKEVFNYFKRRYVSTETLVSFPWSFKLRALRTYYTRKDMHEIVTHVGMENLISAATYE